MKILIVEDDENNVALFETELANFVTCHVVFARSRDSALAALKADIFDLVILDLKIPTQDGGLDSEVNHGLAVHSHVREISVGTPIVVFSAYGSVKLAIKLAEDAERHDVWGCGQEQPMTVYKEKSDFTECLGQIGRVIEHVAALTRIEISTGGRDLNLTDSHKRVLRTFARLNQGANARISPLGGGLSLAKTIRLEVRDEHDATKSVAVAKLGSIGDLRDEEARYHRCIAPALGVGGFAHLIKFLRAGAANVGGIFFGFAGNYQHTLIDVLRSNPDLATTTIAELRKIEGNWQSNANVKTLTVGDIRRGLVGDDLFNTFADRLGFDWQALEQTQIRIKWCCQHRDLHGLNVLVRDGGAPLLIDYGEVEPGPACLDPLILELSLLFHPGCKDVRRDWPTDDQALTWPVLDNYCSGTPLAAFVRACRDWAFAVEPIDKAVYATAYAYCVRQLKFADTDHDLATSITRAMQKAISAS